MKISQVAIQLYTLRDHCQTTSDFAASMKKVREIGYRAVQISGLGPIPVSEINAILADEGLTCCATHEGGKEILEEPASVVRRLQELGCKYTAYPYPAGIDFKDESVVRELIRGLDASGAVLREAGLVLCYHNHGIEFAPFGNSTILETIYAESDPQNLQAELDTYWVQYGGGSPAGWCRKMAGRLPLLHLKDYAFGFDDKPYFCEIGAGNIDFAEVIAAAETSGCEWFIVEQDTCPGDPFVSIRQSFDYIAAKLVS